MDFDRIPAGYNAGRWNEAKTNWVHNKENYFKKGLSKLEKGSKPVRLGTNFQFNSQGQPASHTQKKQQR